jgi:hypothetical protein
MGADASDVRTERAGSYDLIHARGFDQPSAISFWDVKDGLVGTGGDPNTQSHCPGTVLRTTDGGKTFQKVLDTPGGITWIETSGATEAWVQWDRCEMDHRGDYPHQVLLHTIDGGQTWQRLPRSDVWNPAFANTEQGFAFSRTYAKPWAASADGGDLSTSDDGGQTWSSLPGPCHPSDYDEGLISAPSPTKLRALCIIAIGAGSEARRFATSSDGGLTWKKMSGSLCPLSYYVRGMDFGSPTWGLVYADDATMCMTTKGGKTWKKIDVKSLPRWGAAHGPYTLPDDIAGFQAQGDSRAMVLLVYRKGIKLAATSDRARTWSIRHRWRFRNS